MTLYVELVHEDLGELRIKLAAQQTFEGFIQLLPRQGARGELVNRMLDGNETVVRPDYWVPMSEVKGISIEK